MQFPFCNRWLLILLLFVSTYLMLTCARGGRGGGGRSGGGSRGGGSSGGYGGGGSRYSSRPAPAPTYRFPAPVYRPPPAPVYRPPPAPVYRPPPAHVYRPPPAPVYRPPPAPVYKPPSQPAPPAGFKPAPSFKSSEPVVVKQPASNPNFKQADHNLGSADKQPAYNPNYKSPSGPPPPYSPAGQSPPNAPIGPPPPYRPPPGAQPPPYPGNPAVRPPAYPGLAPGPYPVQPGHPNQPTVNRPYPVQPGHPGTFYQQPGINRPYPVQPGVNYPHTGGSRPYPQQPLGGNVWQPHHSVPAPAYMNYGGIPTGTNMYTKPHKNKGFIGSLMSTGKHKSEKKNKYYGSYPSPYGVGGMAGAGHMGGGFLGKHGKSAAMYTIFPYVAAKKAPKLLKPRFSFMPIYMPRPHYHGFHHHHYHRHDDDDRIEIGSEYEKYFDVYNDEYAGKCQHPIKKNHSEIECKPTFKETHCDAKCAEGYRFSNKKKFATNKCWHVTGVWRPTKNFPECKPVCENKCMNGGECIRPEICKCPVEYRGSRCQFRKSYYLKCNILDLTKKEKVGWVCNHSKNESVCKITCKEPGHFESPPADEYKCSPEGVWKPDTIPPCVVKEKQDSEGKDSSEEIGKKED